jgi:hypothetical protein
MAPVREGNMAECVILELRGKLSGRAYLERLKRIKMM